jgi:SAM-dependent methyltransferase
MSAGDDRALPTERFGDRVGDYVRARPGYPEAVWELCARAAGLGPGAAVAELGAGTGIATRALLARGWRVYAVEPNEPMRRAAEAALGGQTGFVSVAASAEATTLSDASVSLVVAAQAFHWFDPLAVRRECQRILAAGGWVALVWNARRTSGSGFLDAYERLLEQHGTDYLRVRHRELGVPAIARFFGPAGCRLACFEHAQAFDRNGLEARLRSSSYVPRAGDATFLPMMEALRDLFERHAEGGRVTMPYDTEVFYGQLS